MMVNLAIILAVLWALTGVGFLIYIGWVVYSGSLGGFGRREPLSFNSMAENNEPSQV